MNVNNLQFCLTTALMVACLAPVPAAEQPEDEEVEFVPAMFPDDERALVHKVKFPDVEGDVRVTLLCDSAVTSQGRFDRTFCFTEGRDLVAYELAVFNAVLKARMIPARVRGKKEHVWFQFSVAFNKTGEKKSIQVFPNQLHNIGEYGIDYIGPQRYDFTGAGTACMPVHGIWLSMTVDEHGIPHDLQLLGDAGGFCAEAVVDLVRTALYIPAFSNGRPVKAKAVEMFFGGNVIKRR